MKNDILINDKEFKSLKEMQQYYEKYRFIFDEWKITFIHDGEDYISLIPARYSVKNIFELIYLHLEEESMKYFGEIQDNTIANDTDMKMLIFTSFCLQPVCDTVNQDAEMILENGFHFQEQDRLDLSYECAIFDFENENYSNQTLDNLQDEYMHLSDNELAYQHSLRYPDQTPLSQIYSIENKLSDVLPPKIINDNYHYLTRFIPKTKKRTPIRIRERDLE